MTSNSSVSNNLLDGHGVEIRPGTDFGVDIQSRPSPSPGGVVHRPLGVPAIFAPIPFVVVGYVLLQTRALQSPVALAGAAALLLVGAASAWWIWHVDRSVHLASLLLTVEIVSAVLLWILWPLSMSWIVLFWVSSSAGSRLPLRQALIFLAAICGLTLGMYIYEPSGVHELGGSPLWALVVTVAVFVIGTQRRRQQQYLRQMEDMVVALRNYSEQLEDAHRQLKAEALQAAALAAAEERNRIAREIHDVLAHSLTVIVMQAQAIKRLARTTPEVAEAQAETVATLARQGLQEARRSVSALRAQAGEVDGPTTLRGLVEDFGKHTGTTTHFEVTGEGRALSPVAWATLYRVTQEALTNARRHGQARNVDVRLAIDGSVRLTVDDDGLATIDTKITAGNGLTGMQERAARLGGSVSYRPRTQGGFHVEVQLPA
jgi:signal transduction histidine kinase